MSVAKIINQQLRASIPTNVFWSWGASKFQAVSSNLIDINESYSGALLFYVRGALHRGHVLISLNGMDEYTISIGQLRKGKMNIKSQKTGIHFDMLGTIIDGMVEQEA
jgi:hypothetical protein